MGYCTDANVLENTRSAKGSANGSTGSPICKSFQTGATAYGGPAMISQIKDAAVNRYGWTRDLAILRKKT